MQTRRHFITAATTAALLAALVAPAGTALAADAKLAQPTDAKLIAAAKAEGKLTFYGSSSVAALKSDAEAFQAAYGIQTTYQQIVSGPLTARVDQEIRGGRILADVIITADRYAFYRWIADGQIAPLPADIKFPDRTDHIAQVQAAMRARVIDAWNSGEVSRGTGHLQRPFGSHANRVWHKLAEAGIAFLDEIPEAPVWLDYAVNKFFACYPVWWCCPCSGGKCPPHGCLVWSASTTFTTITTTTTTTTITITTTTTTPMWRCSRRCCAGLDPSSATSSRSCCRG